MATFTNTSKNSISPTNQSFSAASASQHELNVGDGFNLLVATGFKFIIQPASNGTIWSNTSKS